MSGKSVAVIAVTLLIILFVPASCHPGGTSFAEVLVKNLEAK